MAAISEQIARPRSAVQGSEERTGPVDMALQIVAYIVLTLVAFLMFVPFIFSVVTSFKTNADSTKLLSLKSLFWPPHPTFAAYRTVFDSDIDIWFRNSVIVA